MPWFRADDAFPQHPKVLAIPRRDRCAAIGLWSLAGMWCAGQLTDGFVPDYMVQELGGNKRNAQLLVTVGLWEITDGGYQMHDYLEYNPSAADVRADQARKSEAKARAGRAGGIASGVARRKHEGSRDEADAKQEGSETKPRPVPSRSASKEALVSASPPPPKRATQIPDDFEVTENMRVWATANRIGPNLERETAKFRDHHIAKGSTFKNWEAAWHTWMRKADEYANVRQLPLTASGKEYQPWNP